MNLLMTSLLGILSLWSCHSCLAQDQAIEILLFRLKKGTLTVDSSATTYRQLTRLYAKKHLYHQALAAAQKEANIRRRIQQQQPLAEVYFNIASLYRTMVSYKKALHWGQKSLQIYQKALGKQHAETLSIYLFLAQTYYLKEDYQQASYWVHQTQQGFQHMLSTVPKILLNLEILKGSIAVQKAVYTKAQQYYEQALTLYHQFKQQVSEEILARIYNNLATLKVQQKATLEALSYYQKVVHIRQRLRHKSHFTIQKTYTNIGLCYYQLKDYSKALTFHQKSLSILKKTYQTKHHLIAFLHNHIGATFHKLGQIDSARHHLNTSIDIYDALFGVHCPQSITPLWELAKVFRQQKQLYQSEQYFKKILFIQQAHASKYHPDLANIYLHLAYLYQDKQQYSQAIHYANLAYEANSPRQQHPLDKVLALKIIETQLDISIHLPLAYQKKAFLLLDQVPSILSWVQTKFSYTTDKQNLLQELRQVCEQGIKLSYQLYTQHQHSLYIYKAFELIECNKAVLLSTQIKHKYKQGNSSDSSYALQEHSLAKILYLEQAWAKAEQNLDTLKAVALQEDLFDQYKAYKQQLNNSPQQFYYHSPIPLPKLQQHLNKDQLLINYFYGQQQLYILSVQQKELQFHQINLAFAPSLQQFSRHLLNLEPSKLKLAQSCQELDSAAFMLYQKLIPQHRSSQLLLIPDGLLNYLPFEALTTKLSPHAKGYHQLHYALHQHTISYAYSATSYFYQQYKHSNKKELKILGFAPSYNQQSSIPNISANITEVKTLEQLFNGKFYYHQDAQKEVFLQQSKQFGIVHLATHAYADYNKIQQAKLFFANAPTQDSNQSILLPYEIMHHPLKADFVVLSACQTAIGYWQKGEGVLSLARDFMYAGVPSILTTLWQVNDQTSSTIIQNFYKQLAHAPKHFALQTAKQQYLHQASAFGAHPYFWSGYILIGNSNRLDIDTLSSSTNLWYLVLLCLFFSPIILYCIKIIRSRSRSFIKEKEQT